MSSHILPIMRTEPITTETENRPTREKEAGHVLSHGQSDAGTLEWVICLFSLRLCLHLSVNILSFVHCFFSHCLK